MLSVVVEAEDRENLMFDTRHERRNDLRPV